MSTLPSAARWSGLRSVGSSGPRQSLSREAYDEAGAAALARLDHDPTPVRLREGAGDREAEARPLLLRREEGGEHGFPVLLGDARTLVGHAELHPAVAHGALDDDLAPGGRRVDGVPDDVREGLAHLQLVERRAHLRRAL